MRVRDHGDTTGMTRGWLSKDRFQLAGRAIDKCFLDNMLVQRSALK